MKKAADFKYRARFSQHVALANTLETCVETGADALDGFAVAKAAIKKSQKEIEKLFPASANLDKNFDLIGIHYDAAVVNHFNKWGQGISMATALKLKDLFIHKPNNVEHDEVKIIGHTVNAYFSEHGLGGKYLTDKEAKGRTDRVDISLASVLYPRVDEEFVKLALRSTKEDDALYHFVSASWEIAFDEYHIALGSNELDEAEIITDPEEIKHYTQFLKSKKGSGVTPDGLIVNQLIVGDAIPVGIGFTSKPAGEVKGIALRNPLKEKKTKKKKKKAVANDENISQNEKEHVNSDKAILNSNMDKKDNNEATATAALLAEIQGIVSKGKTQEEMQASVTLAIKTAVEDCNGEYAKDLKAEQDAKAKLEKTLSDLQEKFDDLDGKFTTSSETLKTLEDEKVAQLAVATLNERVGELDEEYELTDEARASIISDIKEMDDDNFEGYKTKLSTFLAASRKENIAQANTERQEAIDAEVKAEVAKVTSTDATKTETETATASTEEKVEKEASLEDALETATASEATVSASSDNKEQDIMKRFEKAFEGDNKIQIKV
tara:strand:- start:18301 stop:19956 length:1656 start_codon:yes stop_codon:yes gene_type:complete